LNEICSSNYDVTAAFIDWNCRSATAHMPSSCSLAYLIINFRTETFCPFIINIRMDRLKEKGQVIVEVHFIPL